MKLKLPLHAKQTPQQTNNMHAMHIRLAILFYKQMEFHQQMEFGKIMHTKRHYVISKNAR